MSYKGGISVPVVIVKSLLPIENHQYALLSSPSKY
jgi:hypothetical protein